MNEEVLKFHKDGYVILKKVFTNEQITNFKNQIKELNNAKNLTGELVGKPIIGEAIFNQEIVFFLKKLFNGNPVYFGDSTARYEHLPGHRGMHKDSNHDLKIFPSNEYPIVMGGIYLQDHKYHSGGLKVVPESHKKVFLSKKTILEFFKDFDILNIRFFLRNKLSKNIQSEIGDVVLWSQRLVHSPYAVRLKFAPNLSLPPFIENWIPISWILPWDGSRGVMFFSFGAESEQLEFHIKKHSERKSNYLHWKLSNYCTDSIRRLANENGITLRFDGVKLVESGFIPIID